MVLWGGGGGASWEESGCADSEPLERVGGAAATRGEELCVRKSRSLLRVADVHAQPCHGSVGVVPPKRVFPERAPPVKIGRNLAGESPAMLMLAAKPPVRRTPQGRYCPWTVHGMLLIVDAFRVHVHRLRSSPSLLSVWLPAVAASASSSISFGAPLARAKGGEGSLGLGGAAGGGRRRGGPR